MLQDGRKVSSSCYLTRDKVQHLSAASSNDDFLANLGTPWPAFPACLESWPFTGLPPTVDAGWPVDGSVKLMDMVAIDGEEAGATFILKGLSKVWKHGI